MIKYFTLILLSVYTHLNGQEIEWSEPVSFGSSSHWMRPNLLTSQNLPIVCYKVHNGPLLYRIAKDECGLNWEEPYEIAHSRTSRPFMTIVEGHPTIAYYDSEIRALIYVRSEDPRGTTWVKYKTLDTTSQIGDITKLNIVNGKPAIVYTDDRGNCKNSLKYVIASDSKGESWSEPLELMKLGCGGSYGFEIIKDKPVILIKNSQSDILYIKATDPDGLVWLDPVVIAKEGWPVGMSIIDNKIVIFMTQRNGLGFYLVNTKSLDAEGVNWSMEVDTMSHPFEVGSNISILESSDHLLFSMSGSSTASVLSYSVLPKNYPLIFRDSGIIESSIFSSIRTDIEKICGKMGIVYLTRGQFFYSLSSSYPSDFKKDGLISNNEFGGINGVLNISNLRGDSKIIGITDSENNVIFDGQTNNQNIDMRDYPPGIYTISISSSEGTYISIYRKE